MATALPTTTLSNVPNQQAPLDPNGYFTTPWTHFFQFLYNRVGGNDASSNLQLAAAIANAELTYVKGPPASVDGDVAIFNGTTGLAIKESAVPITSLAPLNSPPFTGIPTAPTAAINTATLQIASTAFVKNALRATPLVLVDAATIQVNALNSGSFHVTLGGNRTLQNPSNLLDGMVFNFAIQQDATGGRTLAYDTLYDFGAAGTPVLSLTASATDYIFGYYDAITAKILCTFRKEVAVPSTAGYFSAHNNGTNQSIPSGTVTSLTLGTTAFNVGSYFAASAWTPPAGRLVEMTGTCSMTLTGSGAIYAAIFKNGVEFKRGAQVGFSGFAAVGAGMSVCALDLPNGTDVYTLQVFQNTGSAMNTNGAASLTWFQGTTIQP